MLVIGSIFNLMRILFFAFLYFFLYFFSKKKSICYFFQTIGPSFIKLGQLLANRPDLIGDRIADSLKSLQDDLRPFSLKKVVKIIENEFHRPINQVFADISLTPVASASVAQVHKAKTLEGDIVAVKILRPNVEKLIKRDIATLRLIASLFKFFSAYYKEKIDDIAELLQICSVKELDLFFEAASAKQMKENLFGVSGFYVPKVYWQLVSSKVLTIEWIDGIPFSNRKRILGSNFDKIKIAKNLVISYFNQVYVHGFFHADMHGGNLFLMTNGDIGVVDFGIMGFIDKKTRIAITEIVIAFLNRDYKRVAKLHIDAGLVPKNVDVNDFVLSCLVIGELVVDKAVGQVSMAKLLENLLKMTRKYHMKTKPELLLLQKTMMLVEGIGMFLDKDLNIWNLAKPFVKDWSKKNIGFDAKIRDFLFDTLGLFGKIPEIVAKFSNR